jgi:hypothetical protein
MTEAALTVCVGAASVFSVWLYFCWGLFYSPSSFVLFFG